MPDLEGLLPSKPPMLPLPRFLTKGTVIRVVTVPQDYWVCVVCKKQLRRGEKVIKAGKLIFCPEHIRKGR